MTKKQNSIYRTKINVIDLLTQKINPSKDIQPRDTLPSYVPLTFFHFDKTLNQKLFLLFCLENIYNFVPAFSVPGFQKHFNIISFFCCVSTLYRRSLFCFPFRSTEIHLHSQNICIYYSTFCTVCIHIYI